MSITDFLDWIDDSDEIDGSAASESIWQFVICFAGVQIPLFQTDLENQISLTGYNASKQFEKSVQGNTR